MQKIQKRRFHKIFTLYLSDSDISKDFCSLIELLPKNSCQDDFSDVSIIYFNGSKTIKEKTEERLKDCNITVKFLPFTKETKELIKHKRFVFLLMPNSFLGLRIQQMVKKLSDSDNNFTNLIFVTRKLTKKVKKYPFFTSHFINADFCPRG